MICKFIKKRKFHGTFIIVGIISIVLSFVMELELPEDAHNFSMFAGMLAGLGTAFIAVNIFYIIREKISSPEKLKQEEIEKNDERNIQVLRALYTIVAVTSYILFVVLAFTFVLLGYYASSWICVGAIYIEAGVFVISRKILDKKM